MTAAAWLEDHPGARSGYTEVVPSQVITKQPPRSPYPHWDWRFDAYLNQQAPPVYTLRLPGGHVAGGNGSVITADEVILGDVSKEWFFGPEQHSLFFRPWLPAPRRLSGRIATVAVASGWNYYHWLLDVLPRLGLLKRSGFDARSLNGLIVNEGTSRYKTETLALLEMDKMPLWETRRSAHFICDELIVPSHPPVSGQAPPWVVTVLRELFLERALQAGAVGGAGGTRIPKRIYLSRAGAKYRRFTNEPEVAQLLRDSGFEEVFTEKMSFLEQVRLFAGATDIVAPHGAGLSNLVFCQPGTRVVEVFSPNYVNGCFWALANWARIDYYYVLGSGRRPPAGRDPHRVEQDITVNMDELKEVLRMAKITG
jgi:capsular polysaccharide biosynthesis protein